MDETDIGTAPQIPGQRSDAVDAPEADHDDLHFEAPSHFSTPSWMGPDRHSGMQTGMQTAPPAVPVQAAPAHDVLNGRVHAAAPSTSQSVHITEGHWVESAPPRKMAGALLLISVAGLVASLVASITTQSPVAIGAAVACGFIVVVFRGALMSSGVTTTELKNGRLTVTRDGIRDQFTLTDPVHLVELLGHPSESTWRLRLESVDGRIVELGPNHVKPEELHPVVAHYRAIADAERIDRERRFNR